jgi:hypothetical protein
MNNQMIFKKLCSSFVAFIFLISGVFAQVVINEGSNMNYSAIADEDGDYPDWIELYNSDSDTISLLDYSISDNANNPTKWILPNIKLLPGEFRAVLCSGKDRKPVSGFFSVINTGVYVPVVGWNTHEFTAPFYWDGVSNILVNTCSYNSVGYTTNSVFNQTATAFRSSLFNFQDGSPASCSAGYGSRAYQRPNMRLNGIAVGTGTVQNSPTDYPAPYGNWYWGARHQMLILASELTEAGLSAGDITSLAFDVVSTDTNTIYDYIDIHMKLVTLTDLTSAFEPVNPNNFLHTNFKISSSGEAVYLFSPKQVLLSSLMVNCSDLDNSSGSLPDGASDIFLFHQATPSLTNNLSIPYSGYLLAPVFSVPSGFYNLPVNVSIENPNFDPSAIYYTTDGTEPTISSQFYTGEPINISSSVVLKAKAFAIDILPSPNAVSSYFFGVNHSTPVLSLATANDNLYGENGIFDNWWFDWEKSAYVEYFTSDQDLIFSQRTGIQMDGGWGGARSNPQHSFRVELDDAVLGDGPIYYPVIPDKPWRTKFSNFYLRNGSNQYLVFPYKDACQVSAMGAGLNNYYSAWRPVSVYINGSYFGLYELREKIDLEYFGILEGADPEQTDILSVTAWYGGVLRAVEGSVDGFYEDVSAFAQINPADTSFWTQADQYFDLTYYNDYIIGESWMGNTDWPWNNVKIYRSDKTDFRWRFCLIDQELAMYPNGWTDCFYDHIAYMKNYDPGNPYINVWLRGIQNDRFRNYFINRFADVMNTTYKNDVIISRENSMYGQTVVEMPAEYARWGDPNNIQGQMTAFENNHLEFQYQLATRSSQVRNHIMSNFGLPNQVGLTLNVYPEGSGKIRISTITPDTYPWQGVYFNGLPVKIEAIAAEGFTFLNWGNNGLISDTLNAVFLDTLNTSNIFDLSFDAYFYDIYTSTPEIEKDEEFSLYPNPANTTLYLKSNSIKLANLSYRIIDIHGIVMKEGILTAGSMESVIDINSLPASVYLLQLSDSKEVIKQLRFVKMRD